LKLQQKIWSHNKHHVAFQNVIFLLFGHDFGHHGSGSIFPIHNTAYWYLTICEIHTCSLLAFSFSSLIFALIILELGSSFLRLCRDIFKIIYLKISFTLVKVLWHLVLKRLIKNYYKKYVHTFHLWPLGALTKLKVFTLWVLLFKKFIFIWKS
jgi:hypothetical protein